MEQEKQNEIIIGLLARLTFGEAKIKNIVSSNKRQGSYWTKAYNACDGKKGVGEIAKIAGVSQPTATVTLKSWEEGGIVYNSGSDAKPKYKRLLKIN